MSSAETAIKDAEERQLQCLLALHALCAADVGVLVQAHGGPGYFVRGLAPYFKVELWLWLVQAQGGLGYFVRAGTGTLF